jgi:hypothetical protein
MLGAGETPMRLWTVQPVSVWEYLQSAGKIRVDLAKLNDEGWIHPQYSWLMWQLRQRIQDSRGGLPWFAYCARPDLRWVRHSRPLGSREVLIEVEPPEGMYVAFPSWAWHEVFCGQYLGLSGAEVRGWLSGLRRTTGLAFSDHEGSLPEPWQAELEASWRRLFLPDLPARSWRQSDLDGKREAVFEVLEFRWVRSVREFTGTGTWVNFPAGRTNRS